MDVLQLEIVILHRVGRCGVLCAMAVDKGQQSYITNKNIFLKK